MTTNEYHVLLVHALRMRCDDSDIAPDLVVLLQAAANAVDHLRPPVSGAMLGRLEPSTLRHDEMQAKLDGAARADGNATNKKKGGRPRKLRVHYAPSVEPRSRCAEFARVELKPEEITVDVAAVTCKGCEAALRQTIVPGAVAQ